MRKPDAIRSISELKAHMTTPVSVALLAYNPVIAAETEYARRVESLCSEFCKPYLSANPLAHPDFAREIGAIHTPTLVILRLSRILATRRGFLDTNALARLLSGHVHES